MKVLLVNPNWDGRVSSTGRRHNRAWPPLDLLNCAAILEQQQARVTLLDARAEPVELDFLGRVAFDYDLVMLTSSPLDRWQCPNLDLNPFFAWAAKVPPEKLYILGAHGTLWPEQLLAVAKARAVIRGEPEEVVRAIGMGMPLHKIAGVSFRNRRDEVVHNPDSKPLDLATLPQPAYHLLQPASYEYELLGDRFALFEVSRGCLHSCSFCLKTMYGSGVRHKEVPQVVAELETTVHRWGFRRAYFIDLDFAWNRELAFSLCESLIARKLPLEWCCQTRADHVDQELLSEMYQAGCRLIHFGIESASARLLHKTGKKMDLRRVEAGVRRAQELGIETACFFMFGFPDETDQERRETFEFAKRLNPTYASFHAVTAYPGTVLSSEVVGQDDVYSINGRYLERQESGPFLRKAYLHYYLRPSYLLERLRRRNFGVLWQQARLFWDYVRR